MKTIEKLLLIVSVVFMISSCDEREYDDLRIDEPVFNGKANITVKALIEKYNSDLEEITGNDTIAGYIVANDISGNLYKQIHLQDETGGICIAVNRYNLYYNYRVGQEVFIACKGLYIGKYEGYPQLGYKYSRNNDGVYAIGQMAWEYAKERFFLNGFPDEKNLEKVVSSSDTVTIDGLNTSHVGRLVTVTDVYFKGGGEEVFATPGAGNSVRTMSDSLISSKNSNIRLTCRNSSAANFAGKTKPKGVGSVTGVLSIYGSTLQLTFRDSLDCAPSRFSDKGLGNKISPWIIDYALEHQDGITKGWIEGYIVGAVAPGINTDNPINGNEDIRFAAPFMNNTVVLAASANEKNWTKCVVVELPSGSDLQKQVNLDEHSGNLGKPLKVTGTLQKYLGAAGLSVKTGASSEFVFDGGTSSGETGLIYGETFGNTATQTGTTWPSVADYGGCDKAGAGGAQVIYGAEGGAVTVRTNSASSYPGASGECNAMMAAAGASLLVNNIATCGATTLSLSFGSNETDAVLAVAYKINGTTQWVPIPYSKSTTTWELVSDLTVNLPAGTNTIKLRFTAAATQYGTRIDDITLTTSDAIGAPVIDPDTGNPPNPNGGTKENPFTVTEGIAKQGTNDVWVKGYIVGCVKSGVSSVTSAGDVFIGVSSGFNSATNVLIAGSANETDYTKCIAVNLPASTALRTNVNLSDNAGNIGKLLNIKGNLRLYFGLPGSRDNNGADFELEGGTGPTPGDNILNAPFTADEGGFTTYSVLGDQVWALDTKSTKYGMVMSGFADNRSYQNEDWLISPSMNLTGKTNVVLTFDHARGPAASMNVPLTDFTLWISTNYTEGAPATATWTQLSIPTHGTTAWGYVSSGDITLPGDKLTANTRFAFKYICSDSESATWEIKNVVVK